MPNHRDRDGRAQEGIVSGPDGMIVYEVGHGALRVPLQVGVVSDTGAVVLLASAPRTVLNDPASVAALQQALEQATTEQARIHRGLYPPPQAREAVLAGALAAYQPHAEDLPPSTRASRRGMIAALTAANIYEPGLLDIALRAYRSGEHDSAERMRLALAAVLQARQR